MRARNVRDTLRRTFQEAGLPQDRFFPLFPEECALVFVHAGANACDR